MLEGKMIHPDSGRWERFSTHSREAEALKRKGQTTSSIADQAATPSDLDLDMFRDLCSGYKQQPLTRL